MLPVFAPLAQLALMHLQRDRCIGLVIPEYAECKEWLKDNGRWLDVLDGLFLKAVSHLRPIGRIQF